MSLHVLRVDWALARARVERENQRASRGDVLVVSDGGPHSLLRPAEGQTASALTCQKDVLAIGQKRL